MFRSLAFPLILTLALALLGSLAWLTRNPEAEVLVRAQNWPAVGPIARWFRDQYLPPETSPETGGTETEWVILRPTAIETPSTPVETGPAMWLLPDTRLLREPSTGAEELARLTKVSMATRLERRGSWYRVRYRATEGWALLEDYDPNRDPPYGEAPEPPGPVESRAPDEEQLALARGLLGSRAREGQLGAYSLLTNVQDGALLDWLHAVALQVESNYVTRYDRQPIGSPRATVVLFDQEGPYRVLEARSPRLTGLHSSGYNASGMVVFFAGRRRGDQVVSTFVHELVHLLNRRALGPALPPWLDEGLADDLGNCRILPDGTFDINRLSGSQTVSRGETRLEGAVSALSRLEKSRYQGGFPDLAHLTRMEWDEFVRGGAINQNYAASSFFIRYLLEAQDGRFASDFQDFLDDVSDGLPPDGESLRLRLGVGWSELNAGFQQWIEELSEAQAVIASEEPRKAS